MAGEWEAVGKVQEAEVIQEADTENNLIGETEEITGFREAPVPADPISQQVGCWNRLRENTTGDTLK